MRCILATDHWWQIARWRVGVVEFAFDDITLAARHKLHASTIDIGGEQLQPRVLSSKRQLNENANCMGNCTAGYETSIRAGDTLIVALDHTDDVGKRKTKYNVELRRGSDGGWTQIDEINTRFNAGVDKKAATEIVHNILALTSPTT